MANKPMPWSLKGVSAPAREAAKAAAAGEGVPMGEWLSRIIREIALAERVQAAAGASPQPAPPAEPRLSSIERAMSRHSGGSS
ncbi:MAG: hypothetical protein GEU92_18450 [Alphaproteobacteria bacterium]|nr:hypothetical protein [Alphaproteobacteria bacterium]